MPSAGLEDAVITDLLLWRLVEQQSFEQFPGCRDTGATERPDAIPAMTSAPASERRTRGRFLAHG
jgi:hypothetical protein